MPFYFVEHASPLSAKQQDDLANAITTMHTELFSAPRFFVNVAFVDVSSRVLYVGGKREKQRSHIRGHIRMGPSRSKADIDKLAKEVHKAWVSIVDSNENGAQECTIFIHGDVAASYEKGFVVPPAGEDVEWVKEHIGEFEQRAEEGDTTSKDLLEEVRKRDVFKGVLKD